MSVDDATIAAFLTQHPQWTHASDALHTTFTFDTFAAAVAAFNTIAALSDAADHHPDLFNSYTTVKITLTSHDQAAVTQRDLDLAASIDEALDR